MIGHCAYAPLNHIALLEKLKRFQNQNIKIILPFSYGDEDYRCKVKKYLEQSFAKDKVLIIETMMNSIEYAKLLNDVDIAIFDNVQQQALGNIWRLAFFGKKLYLNCDGIIKNTLDFYGLQTYSTKTLETIDFEDFIKPLNENEKIRLHYYAEAFVNENSILNAWKKVFNELGGCCE